MVYLKHVSCVSACACTQYRTVLYSAGGRRIFKLDHIGHSYCIEEYVKQAQAESSRTLVIHESGITLRPCFSGEAELGDRGRQAGALVGQLGRRHAYHLRLADDAGRGLVRIGGGQKEGQLDLRGDLDERAGAEQDAGVADVLNQCQ